MEQQLIDLVDWEMTTPLARAVMFDGTGQATNTRVRRDTWNTVVPGVRPGDRISLLRLQGFGRSEDLRLTAPIMGGSTFRAVLKSLERGLRSPIEEAKIAEAYCHIGRFNRESRLSLVKRLESGKLCPCDMLADHRFYEGGLTRGKDGVWNYQTGS